MLGIVSSDAGGAELLSSYVKRNQYNYLFHLVDPAISIFNRKLDTVEVVSLDSLISQSEAIICGSSWKTNTEIDAIKEAKARGKRSVVFLDHWANYAERFSRDNITTLPDEFWVSDCMAKDIAELTFPDTQIKLVENPYLIDIGEELRQFSSSRGALAGDTSILYVCEPTSEHALQQHGDRYYWGYTEQEALRYFLENIKLLGDHFERLVIRPHPSESYEKYSWAEKEFDLPIERGGILSLSEEIVNADIIVGCQTMAMVVGLLAKKRVLSSVPLWGKKCNLPHKEIEHLKDLVVKP